MFDVSRPRADVTTAVWLKVRKATGRQVEVGKDPFLQQGTCFTRSLNHWPSVQLALFSSLIVWTLFP